MNTNQYHENMFYNTMKYDNPLSYFLEKFANY